MNGKDFIEAVNEGKVLRNRESDIRIWNAYNNRIFLSTPQNAIFTSGSAVEINKFNPQDCVLVERGEVLAIIDPACFEIQEE